MKVIVCSQSSSKFKAITSAFSTMYPDEKIEYISVPARSNMHNQPIGVEMTMVGALNRIADAKEYGHTNVDFYVSIESGVNLLMGSIILCFSAVCIYGTTRHYMSTTLSAAFPLPHDIYYEGIFMQMKDVGQVTDEYFETQNSKNNTGCFGLITNNMFTRDDIDASAVMGALIPFQSKHFLQINP